MANTESNNRLIENSLAFYNLRRTQIEQSIGDDTDEQTRSSRQDEIDRITVQQEAISMFIGRGDETSTTILRQLVEPLQHLDPLEYHGSSTTARPSINSPIGPVQVRGSIGDVRQQFGAAVLINSNTTSIAGPANADPDLSRSADVTGGRNNDNDQNSTRPSRTSVHSGPTFSDYGGVQALTACPAVVKVTDGPYLELRCNICGGNSSWVHGTYNKGVRGFQSHFRQVHDVKRDPESVLEQCTHRVVPEDEAARIIDGEQTIAIIPCQQKFDLGRNEEYVGNAITERKPSRKRGSNASETDTAADDGTEATIDVPDHTSPPLPAKRRRHARPASSDNTNDGSNNNDEDNNHGSAPTATESATKRIRDFSVESHKKCPVYLENGIAGDGKTMKYIELRCDMCGGNGSYGSGKFMDGIKGFKMHFHQVHKMKRTTTEIIQHCFHRDIPQAEIEELEKPDGKPTVGFIRCEGSPNVRPKKSYKAFDSAART